MRMLTYYLHQFGEIRYTLILMHTFKLIHLQKNLRTSKLQFHKLQKKKKKGKTGRRSNNCQQNHTQKNHATREITAAATAGAPKAIALFSMAGDGAISPASSVVAAAAKPSRIML